MPWLPLFQDPHDQGCDMIICGWNQQSTSTLVCLIDRLCYTLLCILLATNNVPSRVIVTITAYEKQFVVVCGDTTVT